MERLRLAALQGDKMTQLPMLVTPGFEAWKTKEAKVGEAVEAHSAGEMKTHVHPRAIAVMAEDGVDISGQSSKEMDPGLLKEMDIVITVCGNADATCPMLPPEIDRRHMPVDDPVGAIGTEEEIMAEFRRARDEIKKLVKGVLDALN